VIEDGMIKRLLITMLFAALAHRAAAKEGLLNASYEEMVTALGKPSGHDHGQISNTPYDRYYFQTSGWKTAVLFIDGKSQKLETEKIDGSAISATEQAAILERYDLADSQSNSKIRGWRPLTENHFIRGDGRVHVIKRGISVTVFLDDLPRDFW
jgi:hypothetical protein